MNTGKCLISEIMLKKSNFEKKIKTVKVRKGKGYSLFIGREDGVFRVKMVRGKKGGRNPEIAVKQRNGCLYFLDKKRDISQAGVHKIRRKEKK